MSAAPLPAEEAALLAAVCADPDEDTPRLAYADWLDEHDRPARAEFIRSMVEMQATIGTSAGPRWSGLYDRVEELVRDHWREWVVPLRAVPRVKWPHPDWPGRYDRGFYDDAEFPTARAFADHAARAFSLTPARYVRFARLTPRTTGVLRLPHFRTVRELDLGQGRPEYPGHYASRPSEIGPGGAAALADNPTLVRLETLLLAGGRVGDAGAAALAAAADAGRFPRLHEDPIRSVLDLTANGLTAAGLGVLLRSRLVDRVRRLWLGGNPLGDAGAAVLAARPLPATLWELDLSATGVTDAGVRTLMSGALSEKLEVLYLVANGLTGDAAAALAAADGRHPKLHVLYLGYNRITARGAERLAGWGRGRGCVRVDLRGNPISPGEQAGLRPLFGDSWAGFWQPEAGGVG
ncbi:MAG: hypothetical protein C0501_16830 [Isosphaera sp.]|nr:hypothetical protein [Isosphaera sp.]